jgi:protocatechuate 3,4-dioxygenase beta subunit
MSDRSQHDSTPNTRVESASRREFLTYALAIPGAAAAGAVGCSVPTALPQGGAGAETTGGTAQAATACLATTPDAEGPYYKRGAPMTSSLASATEPGDRLTISGRVLDRTCSKPLVGYILDIWQADAGGAYADDKLRGKVVTDANGRYSFTTVHPGNYGDSEGIRPAHIHFKVRAPNGTVLVTTQMYFTGDAYLGDADYCTRDGDCNSSDPARIIALAQNDSGDGFVGSFDMFVG